MTQQASARTTQSVGPHARSVRSVTKKLNTTLPEVSDICAGWGRFDIQPPRQLYREHHQRLLVRETRMAAPLSYRRPRLFNDLVRQ